MDHTPWIWSAGVGYGMILHFSDSESKICEKTDTESLVVFSSSKSPRGLIHVIS